MPSDPTYTELDPALFPDGVVNYTVDPTGGDADRFEPGIDDLMQPLRVRLGDYLSNNTVHGHDNGYEATRGNAYTVPLGSNDYTFSQDGNPVPPVTAGGSDNTEHVFSPLGGHLDTAHGDSQLFSAGTGKGGQHLGDFFSKGGADSSKEFTGHTLVSKAVWQSSTLHHHGKAESPNDPQAVADKIPVSALVSMALLKNRWNPRRDESPFDPDGSRASDAITVAGDTKLGAQQRFVGAAATWANTMPIAGLQTKLGVYDPTGEPITFDQLRRVGFSMMLKASGEPAGELVNPLGIESSVSMLPGATQLGVPLSAQHVTDANRAFGAPGNEHGGAHSAAGRPRVMAGSQVGTPTDGVFPISFGSFNHYLEPFEGDVVGSRALAGILALAVAVAVKPAQAILSALLEPITTIEALSRTIPLGGSKIAIRPVWPLNISPDDILANLDAHGDGPFMHYGRSSRRNLIFTPAVWEFLGWVIPDSQAGLPGGHDYRNDLSMDPPDEVGSKVTSYFLTVERGIATLFGIVNVGQTPGFYITICREMIRDIIIAARKIAVSMTQNVTGGTSVGGAMNSVSAGIMDMMNSKLTRMVNVLATIGNASLKADPSLSLSAVIGAGIPSGEVIRTGGAPKPPKSYLDSLPAKYSLSTAIGNGSGFGRGAGYRVGNATTALLMPKEFIEASRLEKSGYQTALAEFNRRKELVAAEASREGGALPSLVNKTIVMFTYPGPLLRSPQNAYNTAQNRENASAGKSDLTSDGGPGAAAMETSNFRRFKQQAISTKDRIKIESDLEAEYMPFYFHDLRTNEIVGLQAFLESLTDNFAVSHTSTDAYGRIDSIMIYKSTKRSISLGFTIACTNRIDFDIMYAKINKLVTMIYPQWSKGRAMQNEDASTKFIQPFSQIPTASPVIRLRIGDIIRTNYSKFNLLRLFGMGSEDFEIPDAPTEPEPDPNAPATPDVEANPTDDFSTFISEDTNPILRSFKAVGGKGLAGVITSLGFDWLGGNTWEVARYNARAPKLCKVTMAFSPIHDIAPGIDAFGMNRAPLYPVGDVMSAVAGQATTGDGDLGRDKFNDMKTEVDAVLDRMIDKTSVKTYT